MKTFLRFDSVGGASGDMILSALTALGADLAAIENTVNGFFPEHLHFHTDPVQSGGLTGLRVSVHAEHHHAHAEIWPDAHRHVPAAHTHEHPHEHTHRGLPEIAHLLAHAPISAVSRDRALAVFRALAEAEAAIHGKTPETVHFHEVGAWDSVADIVGACLALEQLGVCGVSCGPLPAGVGTLHCAHGEMPNPAPATQALLAGMAVTQTDEPFELVTPTGAALLRVWTRTLEAPPATTTVLRSAFGFGTRTLNGRPNVLRATLLQAAEDEAPSSEAPLLVLETNLDDCNPEWLGALTADLMEQGALDVWQTPVIMKKGRPGTLLSVLAPGAAAEALRERVFRSTTTFGIRFYPVRRETLARRIETVQTPWGGVPVKIGSLRGEDITVAPEHDACAARAKEKGVTPRRVYEAARQAAATRITL